MAAPVDPATRKKVLRVVFISLLLDLVRLLFLGLESQYTFFCERPISTCTYSISLLTSYKQISFTFILPLFPSLLEFYRSKEAPVEFSSSNKSPSVLAHILTYLNAYKASFSRPIDSRYDIVLLGGALGSLFS